MITVRVLPKRIYHGFLNGFIAQIPAVRPMATMGLGFLLQKVWQSNNRCILEPAIHPVEGLCFIFARNNRKNLITHGRIV